MLRAAVFSLLVLPCLAFMSYQNQIPNGDSVSHPCKNNSVWAGVGHDAEGGGGARNPFGLAFAAAGRTWTVELCQADSDGDNVTNGAELGDPGCTWTSGTTPNRTTDITHPGICEPLESAECINLNQMQIQCDADVYRCPHHTDPSLLKHEMRLDRTTVPSVETTYYCQSFDIPSDRKYYLRAAKPSLVNRNVMHHMIVYGCDPTAEVSGMETPTTCEMREACQTMIAGWGVGYDEGSCYPDHIGVEVGQGVFETVVIEVHWNNPFEVASYTDNSGYDLYLGTTAPPNLASVITVGQMYLDIPGSTPSKVHESLCTAACTNAKLSQPINVIVTDLHMHLIGKSARLELYRNGSKVQDLAYDRNYDYNAPVSHVSMENPIEVRPGDELKMTCEFDSTNRPTVTTYGEGTSDEMCFGFIQYYPKLPNFVHCVAYKTMDYCAATETTVNPEMVGECRYADFMANDYPDLEKGLLQDCQICDDGCNKFWGEYLYKSDYADKCVYPATDGAEFLITRLSADEMGANNQKIIQGMISCQYGPFGGASVGFISPVVMMMSTIAAVYAWMI